MNKNRLRFWALVFNPLVLGLYIVFCYLLYSLAQYGGVSRRMPYIAGSAIALVLWITGCLIVYYRRKRHSSNQTTQKNIVNKHVAKEKQTTLSKWWLLAASISFIVTTIVTGYHIYQSAINYQGRLAWYVQELIHRRYVDFPQNQLYEDDLDGLFSAVDDEVDLPDELYLSTEVDVTFSPDGKITSFYASLFGENEEGENESFLISYDQTKSEEISIWLNGVTTAEPDEQNALEPFRALVNQIPFRDITSDWNQDTYGILYDGVRSWGYNTEGIVYFDDDGDIRKLETAEDEIIGYAVSVYAPHDSSITPVRFMAFTPEYSTYDEAEAINEQNETYFVNEDLGYQLEVVDAATGSRFYALNRTEDGGESWDRINLDPFLGNTGVSSGITFIDEELGFIALSRGGRSEGQLYRTSDGGFSFERVELPEIEVPLTDIETYNPFDYPEMPYEENGWLYLEVGQGQDGDYNGGTKALYRSSDNGEIWEFIEEINE